MTPISLATRITDLSFSLLSAECAIDAQQHVVQGRDSGTALVTWAAIPHSTAEEEFPHDRFATMREYKYFLGNRQYSVVLSDGSLLQMSYALKRGDVVWHRLCYYPCPITIESGEVEQQSLADLIDELDWPTLASRLRLRTPVRFDFDPSQASDTHPTSHMTLNDSCCRIPVRSFLDVRGFIRFVFANFYPDLWATQPALHALPDDRAPLCIAEQHSLSLHLHWYTPIAL